MYFTDFYQTVINTKACLKRKIHKQNSKSEVPNQNTYLLQYANEILVVTAAMLTLNEY